jgi:hypothetical protein
MFENTTVTLQLSDFDKLREGEREYKRIASRLSACFDYEYKKNDNPEPPECLECISGIDCTMCAINAANPLYTETLTVDIKKLVHVAKEFSLYGKDTEADYRDLEVKEKRSAQDE